ncbi:MAG: site-2 protease family protein [Candidatus Aminicenantales bacterium]
MSLPSEPAAAGTAPTVPRRRVPFFAKDRPWINALLFLLTIGSTWWVGTSWGRNFVYAGQFSADISPQRATEMGRDPRVIVLGAIYAIVLMAILLAHELGHYFMCRRFGLSATLPFFLPAPSLIGTLGAYIKIRSPVTRKRRLFDIGAAGPLAGFILAVPALLAGIALSKVVPAVPVHGEEIIFGEPLLLTLGAKLFLKNAGPGMAVAFHPVAFAGWVGVLVTALNLLPLGQLDGGHIVYAVFGSRSRLISKIVMGLLVVLGIFVWAGWLIWFFLLLIMGLRHPPVWDEIEPLGRKRTIVAALIGVIFILSFIPSPVQGYNIIQLVRSFWP